MSSPREREFRLPALTLAALSWGEDSGHPVIALHGWLDNAGSFDLLAPELAACHCVALDLAGHGKSSHRSLDSAYNIWQDVGDVLDIADALGWERFSLLGHSRGGAIATLFAGTFPDRIERLMLVEGGLPFVGEAADAPQNLAKSITQSRQLMGKRGRVYGSREKAIAERVNGFSPVTEQAADILARRSLKQTNGGWQWQADQRLKAESELKLTRELLAPFLERVAAPAICILADDSPFGDWPIYREMLDRISGIEVHRISGRHHFHLEGEAPRIAAHLNRFLARP